jgi:hypothetical protein
MSVELVLRAVEIFRAHGVPVTFEPGWDRRGNGQTSAYQGGIEHHVAGGYNATCPPVLIQGRSDLAGPLCNFAGLSGGGIHVVAAHPANHAGASGGPSNGPFPRTNLFNRLVMGLEICYPGNSPMTDAQYRTAKVFAYAMKVLFGDIERCRAHAETSIEGKWDPGYAPGKTISMAVLRADAAKLQEGEDMSAEAERQIGVIHDFLAVSAKAPNSQTVHDAVWAVQKDLDEFKAAVMEKLDGIGSGGVDVQALANALASPLGNHLRDALGAEVYAKVLDVVKNVRLNVPGSDGL